MTAPHAEAREGEMGAFTPRGDTHVIHVPLAEATERLWGCCRLLLREHGAAQYNGFLLYLHPGCGDRRYKLSLYHTHLEGAFTALWHTSATFTLIMRLWGQIPLSLLALLPFANTAQVVFNPEQATVLSTNLVDALSADPDYTSLLRLLTHAKLIPTLNKLNGSTLFAPTNDAIKRHSAHNVLWEAALRDSRSELHDNIQEQLRQELFYHMLNYSIGELPREHTPEVLQTLHYPRKRVEPPTRDPPPSPPWMPLPGGTLGGEPQRLRAASRDAVAYVGVDAFGEGGAKVTKELVQASNGILVGIDEVLQVPPDLGAFSAKGTEIFLRTVFASTVIMSHPSLSYLKDVLTAEIIDFFNSTSKLTLFLPVDAAWEALPHYERLYLESKYATDDLTRIVNMHAVAAKSVKYSELFKSGLNCEYVSNSLPRT